MSYNPFIFVSTFTKPRLFLFVENIFLNVFSYLFFVGKPMEFIQRLRNSKFIRRKPVKVQPSNVRKN